MRQIVFIVAVVVGIFFSSNAFADEEGASKNLPANMEVLGAWWDSAVVYWETAEAVTHAACLYAVYRSQNDKGEIESTSVLVLEREAVEEGANLFFLREKLMKTDSYHSIRELVAGHVTSKDGRQHLLSLSGLSWGSKYRLDVGGVTIDFRTPAPYDSRHARTPTDCDPTAGMPATLDFTTTLMNESVLLEWHTDPIALGELDLWCYDSKELVDIIPIHNEHGESRVTIPAPMLPRITRVCIPKLSYLSGLNCWFVVDVHRDENGIIEFIPVGDTIPAFKFVPKEERNEEGK